MGWLEGDVALVTGAGSGLGRAIVARFIQEGAKVVALEWSQEKAGALVRDFGSDIAVTVGDVRSMADNERAVAQAVGTFGKLDILVGNAGILDHPVMLSEMPSDKLSDAFDEVMGVNVKGYILAAHAASEQLTRNQGSIVFTASGSSFRPGGGGIFYTTSKHAVVGVVRQLAYEMAPEVRVNAVGPGPMRTDLRGSAVLGQQDQVYSPATPEIAESLKGFYPLHCVEPEDYVGLYVALASRQNSATITGETINASDGSGIRGTVFVTAKHARQAKDR